MIRCTLILLLLANSAFAQFAGDIDEDGFATAIDVVRLSNHLNGSVLLSADRLRLADVDQNAIVDADDLTALADAVVGQRQLLLTSIAPTARAETAATNQSAVTISGSTSPNASVQVDGAANSASTTADANGAYSVAVTLLPNQLNRLYVSSGGIPRTLSILHDDIPPRLIVDSPGDSSVFASEPILGRVYDASTVTVTVNGQTADVAHDSFLLADFAIPLGSSTITVLATDAVGNQISEVIAMERIADDGSTLRIVSLDPPAVTVPWPNKLVTFTLAHGDGNVDGARIRQVFSDAFGFASIDRFEAGADAGRGNHRLHASSVDIPGVATFIASVDAGPAVQLHADSGDRQIAEAGAPAPRPLRVWANDGRYGIAGVSVQFTSRHGHFAGADSATVVTDATGHAEVIATLAPDIGNQEFTATFAGNQLPPVTFVVEAIAANQVATSLRGIVLDTVLAPLAFATCELRIGGSTLATHADIEGAFRFDDISSAGYAELSISLFGYSSIDTRIALVPNADNRVPEAIRLTRAIDQVLFDNSSKFTLTNPDFGGLRFFVAADSLADAPRALSLDPVHPEDLPVPLPDGVRASIAWFLGPADSQFDPPIAIELPNVTGLPPGSVAHILGYDASIGDFVVTATATVSPNGDRVRSDEGSGISRGGFGAYYPPIPAHGAATTCIADCGDPVALIGGSLDTRSHAFIGEELVLDVQIPSDPGQEATLFCGSSEKPITLAPQVVTARIDVYHEGILIDTVSDSYIPEVAGSYTLKLVAELRGPCPKNVTITRQVDVVDDACAVATCLTPATLSGSPVLERLSSVLPLGSAAVTLGFALRSPQVLEGGEAEYSCDGISFTRTRATCAIPYTWELRRRHDDAVITAGTGTVAGATVADPGCYYAIFTGQPGGCVGAGTLVFESQETSVIDASLSLEHDLVCVGDELTGTLDLSAPPCDGSFSLSVSGDAELVSSSESGFVLRGTAPGVASIALEIDGTVFAQASFTVFQLAFPGSYSIGIGKEAALPVTVEPASAAAEFADFAIPLTIVAADGDAQIRSGITLTRDLEVTLGGLAQGGIVVRALAAGSCTLQTPCADASIQVIELGLSGVDLCTGKSATFALASNVDIPVTLRLRTAFGTGSARFASSGNDELQLSAAGDFVVDALSTSSDPGNLLLEAFLGSSDTPCASFRFTIAEFAFSADPLKICVGAEQAVSYSVSPSGFVGDVSIRSSDAAKAVASEGQVLGVSSSDSVGDTQLILSLGGSDCATRTFTVIEVTLPADVRLCMGQANTVSASARPNDASCSVELTLNEAGVTFPDGSRSRVVDLATLNSDGIDLVASAPSVARSDSQLSAIGPNNEICAQVGITVLDIGFSSPGNICIGAPGSVVVRAKPPLPDTNIDLVLSGPGLAGFAGGGTTRSYSMAELDGQTLAILGLAASTACDDMSISANTTVGGTCATASFTVVDISFDVEDDKICVGSSRNIGITAQPADANCLVNLQLSDAVRASFTGGASSIQKSLAELDSNGIDVTALSVSAAANDVGLGIDVGTGSNCYQKSLTMVEISFPLGELTFCRDQQATLAVTALPNVADCSVPIQLTGGLTVAGGSPRTLASLNSEGLQLSGSSGSVSIMVGDEACATATPTVLDLAFPAPDLKVCLDGSLNVAVSANPALSTVSGTLTISDGSRATFADGTTTLTDTIANLAAGVEILGVATSSAAGDIALGLAVNGVECASAPLTVFDIEFALATFEVCVGDSVNVNVTAIPSVTGCEVTITTIGDGGATIDGQAARVYNLADLNLLGVSVQGTATGSLTLIIDTGAGCSTVPFTVCDTPAVP
ncbi:MAG: hypothetical protein ACI8W8_001349 [Rhodothermales bacterium]|jgi:hypothetical protein